ncbi:T9SS type A sorting domain-containing protein [Lacinutrix sp.]|uniref:T9SS type A sorting domain-containing protein n=1 Tax=Lacinutrix sp. TaxID=1937692 RepID=UPI0025C42601|nr:T9SS type A sorting domain-containing protein [Lacinutrix sp.]
MKKTLLLLTAFLASQAMSAQLYINEILVSPPGTDSQREYIELRGIPNAMIAADTYLIQIEGDGESNPGDVESNGGSSNGCTVNNDGTTVCPQGGIIDLSGVQLGSNGILLILTTGNIYTIDSAATVLMDVTDGELEDQSHTFFLVNTNGNGAPSSNDDIDGDDDGEIDAAFTSIWTFMDGISFADDDGAPSPEFAYADVIFAEAAIVPTLMRPASATVISTATQFDYAARIGNSTGNLIEDSDNSDWLGSDVPSSGNYPNWLVGSNSTSVRAVPESFEGSELNHIGAPNPSVNTLGLVEVDVLNSLSIYPNPANTILNIKSTTGQTIDKVEVFNILGANVLTTKTLTNDAINVSEMAKGVYLVKINSGANTITKKLVIE